MREQFLLVRPACDFGAVMPEDAALTVVNGRMEARNAQMAISVPCDFPDLAASCADLDFAFRKMPECTVSVTKASVMLKAPNGSTTRVKALTVNRSLTKPDIKTVPIPDIDDLLGALDDVWPFTEGDSAKPWSIGARIDAKTITATNSMMLCRAELAQPAGIEGVTLSRKAIEYIRDRRGALKAWGVDATRLLLEFDDDSWASVARMPAEMPNQAVALVDTINDWDGLMTVTGDYRASYLNALDRSDGMVSIFPGHIYATKWSSEHEELVETPLGDLEGPVMFTAKDLATVLLNASEIAFDRYPNPVPFKTPRGSLGLIAGRTS